MADLSKIQEAETRVLEVSSGNANSLHHLAEYLYLGDYEDKVYVVVCDDEEVSTTPCHHLRTSRLRELIFSSKVKKSSIARIL